MNYKDQWAEDENGKRFLFTVGMQRKLDQAGLPVEAASLKELETAVVPATSAAPRQQETAPSYKSERSEPAPARTPRPKHDDIEPPESIQIDPQTGKFIGRMKWYNVKKGYGFLMRGGSDELFFHKSNVIGNPLDFNEGQWILYDVEETHKGTEGTEIEPYEGEVA